MRFLNWLAKILGQYVKPPTPTPTPVEPKDSLTRIMLEYTNRDRKAFNREPLLLNAKLMVSAQKHADWMARNGVMSHTGENGSDFSTRERIEGYSPMYGGENIAEGYDSIVEVERGWMTSPGHRANILSKNFKDVGFGISVNSKGVTYWCTDFGSTQLDNSLPVFNTPGGISRL